MKLKLYYTTMKLGPVDFLLENRSIPWQAVTRYW